MFSCWQETPDGVDSPYQGLSRSLGEGDQERIGLLKLGLDNK
jgi:hypothetical protein